ncbi:hypothetical protein F4861DRAFT_524288 [Xylaria intraflava]|nr:hypothetical protein F4861DRAFT_524288 [Xylaria intraflava]
MAYSGTLDDLDLSLEGFEMPQFTNLDNLHGLLSDSEYMDPSDAMTPWNQSITYASDTMNSPWNSTPEREDVFFNADNSVSPVTSPPEKPDSGCSCFSQAAATYEAIETAIWGQGELRTNTDDVLQSQKKALSECEELLECQRCSAQSAYIMLLLSMCRRILATLEELRRGDAGNNPTHNPDARKRRRHGEDSDADDESRTRGYGISIRNRQLDDDDEHLVLQSLVAARAARLDRLLSSLDKVVSEHGWPAHKGLVQDLQGRLVGNSFDVGKIRRAWTG